jgi:hypothetical protein
MTKVRLGPIAGVPVPTMKVVLKSKNSQEGMSIPLSDDAAFLGSYPIQDFMVLQVRSDLFFHARSLM